MDDLKKAVWIISSQKKLENIPNSVQGLNTFSSTIWAGRCGRLLSNIRSREYLTSEQLEVFANSAGILTIDLDPYLNVLEKRRLLKVKRSSTGDIIRIEDCLLSKEDVLTNTTSLFGSKASPIEIANLSALEITSEKPLEETNLKHALSKQGYSEENVDELIDLQINFQLLQRQSGYGLSKPFIFNEYIWGQNVAKIARAIGSMTAKERRDVEDIIHTVKNSQGIPVEGLSKMNKDLLRLLVKVGMLDVVTICTTKRTGEKDFVTTPQMWGTIKLELLSDDILDEIKLFLDSIRYGEHYGQIGTGRILHPEALVGALISTEKVGPCSAIGTDYIMLEKAGIIDVQRATEKLGEQYYMKLLKQEVGERVNEIVKYGILLPGTTKKQLDFDFPPATSYRDPETNRIKTKITTQETKEAFSTMIDKLRSR